MKFKAKSDLSEQEKEAVRLLWNNEYPTAISLKSPVDFESYLNSLEDQHHVLVFNENEKLQAWFIDFVRNDERNFAMIVSREAQGKGLGKKLLLEAQSRWRKLNGWVVKTANMLRKDGSVYPNPASFYEKCGFTILKDQVWKTEVMETVKMEWEAKSNCK